MSIIVHFQSEINRRVRRTVKKQTKIIKRAARLATNDAAAKMRTRAVREIAKKTGIKASGVRRRVRFKRAWDGAKKNDLQAKIWTGTKPINAGFLGRVRQTKDGVRAGSRFFKGARKGMHGRQVHVMRPDLVTPVTVPFEFGPVRSALENAEPEGLKYFKARFKHQVKRLKKR